MTPRPDFDIQEELKKLPARPGVYLMHDESDGILYVGKAIRLKNRVKQYFDSRPKSAKIMKMVQKIAWFEYIVTDSELEALVLECNLIKEYRPPYNTMLMDDKGYPYICVTVAETYPRVFQTRLVKKDKSRYFGPYTSGYAVKQSLELFQKLFHFRTCNRVLPRDIGKERPCLNYHMGRCLGPCTGKVDPETYRENINKIIRFLDGDSKEIERDLKEQMREASRREDFEEAMRCRDILRALEHLSGQQKITDLESSDDRDFIAAVTAEELRAERAAEEALREEGADNVPVSEEDQQKPEEQTAIVSVFFVRGGKLIGREHYHLKVSQDEEKGEILGAFVRQYYTATAEIPKEIFLETEIPDDALTAELLSGKKGRKVSLIVPKRGEKEHFMELAKRNARIMLDREEGRFEAREARNRKAVRELEEMTGLPDLHRMEAFDISNISGFESVGSMVVFVDGSARKNSYRKFRIRTVSGPDDYASMAEVLGRRFSEKHRGENASEKDGFGTDLPDLILMDGGKGQVHVAEEVLRNEGLSIPVAGMVKDDRHRTRGLYFHDEELPVDTHGEAFKLITRIQDEAHRFAITYHRGLHTKGTITSVLSGIPGIGSKRETTLIRRFEDIDALRKATAEEIAALPGFTRKAAEEVVRFLQDEKEKDHEGQDHG